MNHGIFQINKLVKLNESLIGIGNYEKLLEISVTSKNMERFAQFEFEEVSI